jgi:N6-L-threonylcarbamoyladenine synthase
VILSIESSCDDSSIAVTKIKDCKLLFHQKISQEKEHSQYGGVVPELASRLHAIALPKLLVKTKEYFKEIKAIAVTNEPGLIVTLNEGIMMAKALGIALDKPLIGINHLIGHIYSLFIEKEAVFPKMILLVSGGHTMLLNAFSYERISLIATTLDDSFGESFDKVAKMLNLGYPGGPVIEKLAREGKETFSFPIPLKNNKKLAFSYSGLKNAVRVKIGELKNLSLQEKKDIAASFQRSAIMHLLDKTKIAFELYNPKNFAIVGGASANLKLRSLFERFCKEKGVGFETVKMEYCSDNAAMIGRAAIEAFKLKKFSKLSCLKANAKTTFL